MRDQNVTLPFISIWVGVMRLYQASSQEIYLEIRCNHSTKIKTVILWKRGLLRPYLSLGYNKKAHKIILLIQRECILLRI